MDNYKLAISGTHDDFDTVFESEGGVSESEFQCDKGDLILRGMEIKGPFYHVGVYCGNSEVINFAAPPEVPQQGLTGLMSVSTAGVDGIVSKLGVKCFIKENPFHVLRLKSGISEGFDERVTTAMNSTPKYNLFTNNCLHFAMGLLNKQTTSLRGILQP